MSIPEFDKIIEPNDQTEARREHLAALRALIGNAYPNKFARSTVSGKEDTISELKTYAGVVDAEAEMAEVKSKLAEGERPPAEIKDAMNERLKGLGSVRIAGRLTTPPRGNFVHLTDGMAKLQIYAKKGTFALVKNDGKETLDTENGWAAWQLIDHGDFIGVEGYLFVTNTGEVSVHVEKLQFLAKAMLPMPDKMHGIADAEIRQRQRYYDLIGSSLRVKTDEEIEEEKRTGIKHLTTREVFQTRAKIISSMRQFLDLNDYIEVETPMLTPKATGAAARPFKTHHTALDIDLYARIAPELYLKRLVVGGFEKVYELNRNFRNEGISYKHNPEFTMLEFYCAYMDVNGMMDFCEELIRESVQKATRGLSVVIKHSIYKAKTIDFGRFERLSMKEAIVRHLNPTWHELQTDEINSAFLSDVTNLRRLILFIGLLNKELLGIEKRFQTTQSEQFGDIWANSSRIATYFRKHDLRDESEEGRQVRLVVEAVSNQSEIWDRTEQLNKDLLKDFDGIQNFDATTKKVLGVTLNPAIDMETQAALIIQYLFEEIVERRLIQPTFIVDYPKSISPLSKANPGDPNIAERFELFINGMEVANGFSELNDPKEQYERFVDQMSERERGDEEAMVLDEDYIRALSYGMPPAAGIGIGIDRLVMLLANKHSIRDVILFPHMRPEKREGEKGNEGDSEKA